MKQTVCILYGVNEGSAMGRQLVNLLAHAGFNFTGNPSTADVIFAHSGGCFLVPDATRARLIVMVGLPYWPGRPWLVSAGIKVWRDGKLHLRRHTLWRWVRKCIYNARYALNLKGTIRMATNVGGNKDWNSIRYQIIVRNHYDTYCTPNILRFGFKGHRTFVSLPGEHDDCWDNPERYVELIQSQI